MKVDSGRIRTLIDDAALTPRQVGWLFVLGSVLTLSGSILSLNLGVTIVLAFALSWASLVDLDRFVLPDALTLSLILFGIAFNALQNPSSLAFYVFGAVIGYLSLAMVAQFYLRLRRRPGLGLGDAKLFAAAGAVLGLQSLPLVLLVASLSALAFVVLGSALGSRKLSAPLPFGPFIAAGTWLVFLLSSPMLVRSPA